MREALARGTDVVLRLDVQARIGRHLPTLFSHAAQAVAEPLSLSRLRRPSCALNPPPQGAATVKRLLPNAVFVFLTAESEKALVERLLARKTETPEKLIVRAATAREEADRLSEFDYVVVNAQGQLDHAVRAQTAGVSAAVAGGFSETASCHYRGALRRLASRSLDCPQVRDLGSIIDAEKLRVGRAAPTL